MQQEEMLSLFGHLAGLLGSQLTKAQATEFFLAVLKSHLNARRAQIFVFNDHGDPVSYPPNGESSASGCDVSIDVIEQAVTAGQIVVADADIVLPLKIEPKPFGVIVIENPNVTVDMRLFEVIGCMASGLLCAGRPPKA